MALSKIDPAGLDIGQIGGRRNLIINGAMVVNQRNQTVTTSDAFYVDRFKAFYNTSSGTYSIAQDSDAPDNFEYSSKVTITASDDLTGSEFMTLAYYAEGYDVAPLNFGTAAAREFTLSFWVKSSVAGTYGVSFRNHSANRSFVSSYTINSANTWEHKSVTVTADANGSWVKTNGIGLVINWELGNSANYSTSAGSWQSGNYWGLTGGTKLVNTNGATLQLTGVQLEVGSVATPFEHRSYGEELALCQRYYQKWGGDDIYVPFATGFTSNSSRGDFQIHAKSPMRSKPTFAYSSVIVSDVFNYSIGVSAVTSPTNQSSVNGNYVYFTLNSSGATAYRPAFLLANNSTSGYISLDAEL